jgi:hypothetical protein
MFKNGLKQASQYNSIVFAEAPHKRGKSGNESTLKIPLEAPSQKNPDHFDNSNLQLAQTDEDEDLYNDATNQTLIIHEDSQEASHGPSFHNAFFPSQQHQTFDNTKSKAPQMQNQEQIIYSGLPTKSNTF